MGRINQAHLPAHNYAANLGESVFTGDISTSDWDGGSEPEPEVHVRGAVAKAVLDICYFDVSDGWD